MKFFQSTQEFFGVLGISSQYLMHKRNVKSILTMLIFGQALISNYVFLLLKAENFREYTDSFYATATITIAAVNFVIAILKMAESVRFIENCENTIEKSKCSEAIKIVMTPANQ